jgi:hypothetical protein
MRDSFKDHLLLATGEKLISSDKLLGLFAFALQTAVRAEASSQVPNKEYRQERNQEYRSGLQLVTQALQEFQAQHPSIPLHWEKDQNSYITLPQLIKKLQEPVPDFIKKSLIGIDLTGLSTLEAIRAVLKKNNIGYFTTIVQNLLGNELENPQARTATSAEVGWISDESFAEFSQLIEEKWQANQQQPLTTSQLLEVFLLAHAGNLNKSLEELSLFLRRKARQKGFKGHHMDLDTKEWFVTHILDQQSPEIAFNSLPVTEHQYIKDYNRANTMFEKLTTLFTGREMINYRSVNMNFNLENRVGQPYHFFHLLSLLSQAEPEVIRLLTFGEYFTYAEKHGSAKMLSDVFLLRELKEILKIFEQFAHSS